MNETIMQVIYTWPDTGREEVRYERPKGSEDAVKLEQEVEEMRVRCEGLGEQSCYSIRYR